MTRRVVISGLGPVSGLGMGMQANWEGLLAGQSAIARLSAFDPGGLACQLASEVKDFKIRDFVPKSYRKAVKVMARDIELAVAAADLAARDANLKTKCTAPDETPSYTSDRIGCQIGAGLIAADLDEFVSALKEAKAEPGSDTLYDMHKWGSEGMTHLTPLWLLKYLPNMLACHVTIIHDTQGPSNTITCGEASAGLSLGESIRVIDRGAADMCFCGGTESKLNPNVMVRQTKTDRLNTQDNDSPETAVRPFSQSAAGMVVGEGGAIFVVEALDTFQSRVDGSGPDDAKPTAYAEIVGFAATQSINVNRHHVAPDTEGRAIANAIRTALKDAGITTDDIDLVVPGGVATKESDEAECAAFKTVFGDRLKELPIASTKSYVGNCGAGAAGIDICVAAKAIAEQTIPPIINCDDPLDAMPTAVTQPARSAALKHVLTVGGGVGGQYAAVVLKQFTD